MVTSHANGWRLAHGSRVIAIRAFVIIRRQVHRLFCCWYLRSLDGSPDDIVHVAVARGCLGALLWQDKPCSPRASTAFYTYILLSLWLLTTREAAWFIISVDSVCLQVGYVRRSLRADRKAFPSFSSS